MLEFIEPQDALWVREDTLRVENPNARYNQKGGYFGHYLKELGHTIHRQDSPGTTYHIKNKMTILHPIRNSGLRRSGIIIMVG